MTATLAPAPIRAQRPKGPPAAAPGVTFPRTLRSEWLKFSSLRSSWVVLLTAVVGLVAIGLAIAYTTGRNWGPDLAAEDTALSATLQGYHLAELAVGVLGVLFVAGEYATGMIRSTMAAVPARVPVLVAKTVVLGGVALVTMTATSLVAFLASQTLLGHYGHGFSLSDPTALRVVFGTGLYLALMALLGSALGWLTRSTPGGISAFAGVSMLLPLLLGQFLGSWGRSISHYLPGEAGGSFISSEHAPGTLQPGTGIAVLATWVLVALVAAAVLLRSRDA